MKKIFTLLCLALSGLTYAQDTTANNIIAGGFSQIHFYNANNQYITSSTQNGTIHVLFENEADSLLYVIMDDGFGSGNRDLYSVNPFDGSFTLIHDITVDYVNSGDIGEGGVMYVITGNGNGQPGEVYEVDLGTGASTLLFTSTVSGSTNPTATEYHPGDSSLYIFESFGYNLYTYDLLTATESAGVTYSYVNSDNEEHHGAYYDEMNDNFIIGSYAGELYQTNSAPYTTIDTLWDNPTCCDQSLDPCRLLHTLRSDTSYYQWCPGEDSTMISHIYGANSFMWMLDGVPQPTWTNDTIWAKDAGMYTCIFEIGTTGNYFTSEGIHLDLYSVPNVTISGDSLLCGSGATGVLTGANPGGGSVQWYMNGAPLAGETNQTLNITAGGIYNQTKTNMSGCTDSSATSWTVIADPTDIVVTISSAGGDTEICPGDTIVLTGETGNVQWYLDGAMLAGETNATLNAVTAGVYNQVLTLPSGCADSSATSFVITVDPGCGAGIGSNDISLELYPNPVEDQLNIQSTELINAVEIYDLSGKLVISQTGVLSTVFAVNMDNLEQGTYVVKVKIGEKIINRKIVK